jgi:hypothetical protein
MSALPVAKAVVNEVKAAASVVSVVSVVNAVRVKLQLAMSTPLPAK